MSDALTAETLSAKLNEWFPWARWECAEQGRYRCVWATVQVGRITIGGFVVDRSEATERAARCLTWDNARNAAKVWAWKQQRARGKEAGDAASE